MLSTPDQNDEDFALSRLFGAFEVPGSLDEIFQAIADGVTVQDENGKVLYANDAAAQIMGFVNYKEVINLDPQVMLANFEILADDGKPFPLFQLPGRRVLMGETQNTAVVYWRNLKSGSEHWAEIKARPIRDASGKIRFAVNIFRDITEQKRITEEYERINRRNQHILESITDGFFALDKNWRFTYVNKQAEKFLLGSKREELIGKNLFDAYPEVTKTRTYQKLQEAILRNESLRYEECFQKLNIWIETSAYPAKDGLAVYLRDITEQKQSEEANAKLAAVVKYSEDAIIGKNLEAVITSWNKGAESMYGYTEEEVLGKSSSILLPPRYENDIPFIMEQVKKGVSLEHYETKRMKKSGEVITASLTISPVKNRRGEVTGVSIIGRDVTRHRAYEEALRESEERFRAMIENSSDAIVLLDQERKVTYASNTVEKITGFTEEEIKNNNGFDFVHPEDSERVQALYLELLANPGMTVRTEYRTQHKNGTYFWIEIVANNMLLHPSIKSIVINFHDITERKFAEETLQHQYHHDALTDLPNRTYLSERFANALLEAQELKKSVAITLIDLDRFKQINESLGHAVGDRLIQEVSLRLRSCIDDSCILARLGGDEFGILLTDVSTEDDIAKVMNKVLESFKPPFYVDKHELFTTPSIGVSMYPYDGREPATLFKNAETALYRAKEHGRNTYQFYTTTMNATAYERLTMESRLRHAIENNEFVLFYQPQIDVFSGKIVGAEELIRWQRPDSTLVLPDRFIPLAEANGLIEPIGRFVIRESLRQAKLWHDAGYKLVMAINLSPRQFKQKGFERMIISEIEEAKIDPTLVEFELTESVLAENPESVMTIMHALRERGVKFCLDDFSTGYSSLRYIKQFPVDMLKIERTFIKGIPHDVQNAAIAKSIITLGRSLNMEITAEGVEYKSQLAFLRDNLCNRAQGYLFNGAMPAHSLTEILGEDRYVSVMSVL